jgi:ketosteroid isomerase-like protein
MASQTTSPAANVELVRAAADAFNAGDTDECLARITPDFVINLLNYPNPCADERPGGKTLRR